jgi:arabinogalactan endo-1,4-beta-galactosidase
MSWEPKKLPIMTSDSEPAGNLTRRSASYFVSLLVGALSILGSLSCGGGASGASTPPPATKMPPNFVKAYGAGSVALNGSTTLTFSLSNPNTGLSLSGIGFTDNLPTGQFVGTSSGLNGRCGGGTITAAAGSNSVALSGATLAASASCSFELNVTGTASGTQNNTTGAVTSNEAGNGQTASATLIVAGPNQQPPQPIDITPIGGQLYYVLNQFSGLQTDLNNNSATKGDHLVQQPRTFTNTSQRWTFTAVSGSVWQISNARNGLCVDSANISGTIYVVQNPCVDSTTTQRWILTPTSNGYYTISNNSTGLLIDVASTSVGAFLDQTALSGNATQSQQWLLRPAFFRGVDNALLEKQEAARIATGLTWWKDTSGVQTDVLQVFKNHGVNIVRVRPSSAPPYSDPSQTGCSGNACDAETDAQDLDLAKRTKNLGMSLELTLLFDGGSSSSIPPAWSGHTLTQLQTDIYNYVKAEIMSYRQAGTMPDLVSIGNEVDTGFLGSMGSPAGANFGGFAALQIQAIRAVRDAAADTSLGPAIPAPLTCIHITPAWDLTQFFTNANQNSIPFDAICQSYYPFFHGPLTDAQSNPNHQPVEQDVLVAAANNIGKPIFIVETAEHYENGFGSNDSWYAPPSPTLQAQFLSDLQTVQHTLPNNLGMGVEYWDPAGVNIPRIGGGWFNGGTDLPDAIYIWNGLTIFDNADTSGTTNANDPNYSTPLPALDALGGR